MRHAAGATRCSGSNSYSVNSSVNRQTFREVSPEQTSAECVALHVEQLLDMGQAFLH